MEAAERHGDLIEAGYSVLKVLVTSDLSDRRACAEQLAVVAGNFSWLSSIVAVSPDGRPICGSRELPADYNLADVPFFQRAIIEKTLVVGEARSSGITGMPVVNLALPIVGQGQNLEAVFVAAIHVKSFGDLLRNSDLPESAEAYLFDVRGNVLAQMKNGDSLAVTKGLFAVASADNAFGRRSGIIEISDDMNSDRIFAYSVLSLNEGMLVLALPRKPLLQDVRLSALIWGGGLVLSIALGIAISWVAAELLVLRSARRLLAATMALTAGTATGRTRLPTAPCELGELSWYFSLMVKAVRDRERKMRQAMNEAVAARQAEASFLAQLSHELRTPLNAILGFAEILRDGIIGPGPDPRYREYASDIHNSGTHLLALINDLLEVSRAHTLSRPAKVEPVDLAAEVELAFTNLRMHAEGKRLHFACEQSADIPVVLTDQRMLRQILLNVLSNAVKYTPDGGSVLLSVSTVRDVVRIKVTDTGVGMSKEHLQRVFQPFTRADDNPYVVTSEGSGLGLFITRELMHALGGTVRITSGEGQGTTVVLTLPLH